MLRRTLFGRAFGALFAVWFALFQTEPALAHACAMHDGHGAAEAVVDHSAHLGSPASVSHDETPVSDPDSACTCPGGCAAAAVVAVPATSETLVDSVIVLLEGEQRATASLRPASAGLVLPFANGPPTV